MANNTATQLRENPQLQRMPQSHEQWRHFINELVKWVIDLDVKGRLTSDKNLPQVILGNMGSIQKTIPVSSTDAGATATVDIAAHTLARSSTDVDYSSGSITGLDYETTYYIYADDANFEGGAVTYVATTFKEDVIADVGRYFVSEVTTPSAASSDTIGGVGGGFAILENDITVSGLPAASTTGKGIVELAIASEVDTGTDATRAVTPDSLEGSALQTAVDLIAASTPTYTPSNDATDRAWDANSAVTGTGIDVADAGPTNVALLSDHDALVAVVQELSDVVATVVSDLQTKNVFG